MPGPIVPRPMRAAWSVIDCLPSCATARILRAQAADAAGFAPVADWKAGRAAIAPIQRSSAGNAGRSIGKSRQRLKIGAERDVGDGQAAEREPVLALQVAVGDRQRGGELLRLRREIRRRAPPAGFFASLNTAT